MQQSYITENYKKLSRIFGEKFKGPPIYVSLGEDSEYYNLFANVPQTEFQKSLDNLILKAGAEWSVSGYLENRATILNHYPQMAAEKRFYHLGIDINGPCGTKLYAPHDCIVIESKYEEGKGNYGGLTILKCKKHDTEFYMLFGHLNPNKLPLAGTTVKKDDPFAELGSMDQNGNWYYSELIPNRSQLSVIAPRAVARGFPLPRPFSI